VMMLQQDRFRGIGTFLPELSGSGCPQCVSMLEGEYAVSALHIEQTPVAQKAAWCGLCVFAAVNPAVGQMGHMLWPQGIASLTLMQWFQGSVFMLELSLFVLIYKNYSDVRSIQSLAIIFCIGLFVFLFKSSLECGGSFDALADEAILYFKTVFWTFMWLIIGVLVRSRARASTLLTCVVLGASVDALFKIIGFFIDAWHPDRYAWAGVSASLGAEGVSGKATVGFLVPSLFLCWYLLREKPWKAVLLSQLFFLAVLGTYDRAGQVALFFSLLWALAWLLLFAPGRAVWGLFSRFIILSMITVGLYAATYGFESFTARWVHELDRDGTISGSGRMLFYGETWKWFWAADGMDTLLGQGVGRTYDMIETASGMHVHTHSDLFDLMSYGGVFGLLLYACLLRVVFQLLGAIPYGCFEFQIAGAIVAGFLTMSLVTGQLNATQAMFTVGASLWCLRLCADPTETPVNE